MKVRYDNDLGFYELSSDETSFSISGIEAASMVQELYRLGLEFDMPSADSYLQGKLEATEKHLEDLRRLVMDGIAPEKK